MNNEIDVNYVNQIQKYPLLTADEEAHLSHRIESGDKSALTALINSNLRLVVSVAHKFNGARVSMMDLIQEGNMGLMCAAEKYHYSYKTRFSTYAYPWIVQYMMRYINSRVAMIPLPHRKDDMIRKIQAAQNYLFQQNGHEASTAELAVYLGIPEEKVRSALSYAYSISSLDSEVDGEESTLCMSDMIADNTYSPEVLLLREEEKRSIRDLISSLPVNEQQIIMYRYNFDGDRHTKTLREISRIVGVSAEAVRQTEMRAVRHLKNAALVARAM